MNIKKRGFSLMEVLLVLGVLMVLAGWTWPGLEVVRERVYRERTRALLEQYLWASRVYRADRGEWPLDGGGGEYDLREHGRRWIEELGGGGLQGGYFQFGAKHIGRDGNGVETGPVDSRGNDRIFFIIDDNRDGFIDANQFGALSAVERPQRLRADAVMYVITGNSEDGEGGEWIGSWE